MMTKKSTVFLAVLATLLATSARAGSDSDDRHLAVADSSVPNPIYSHLLTLNQQCIDAGGSPHHEFMLDRIVYDCNMSGTDYRQSIAHFDFYRGQSGFLGASYNSFNSSGYANAQYEDQGFPEYLTRPMPPYNNSQYNYPYYAPYYSDLDQSHGAAGQGGAYIFRGDASYPVLPGTSARAPSQSYDPHSQMLGQGTFARPDRVTNPDARYSLGLGGKSLIFSDPNKIGEEVKYWVNLMDEKHTLSQMTFKLNPVILVPGTEVPPAIANCFASVKQADIESSQPKLIGSDIKKMKLEAASNSDMTSLIDFVLPGSLNRLRLSCGKIDQHQKFWPLSDEELAQVLKANGMELNADQAPVSGADASGMCYNRTITDLLSIENGLLWDGDKVKAGKVKKAIEACQARPSGSVLTDPNSVKPAPKPAPAAPFAPGEAAPAGDHVEGCGEKLGFCRA